MENEYRYFVRVETRDEKGRVLRTDEHYLGDFHTQDILAIFDMDEPLYKADLLDNYDDEMGKAKQYLQLQEMNSITKNKLQCAL
jgi:hypothetical protein